MNFDIKSYYSDIKIEILNELALVSFTEKIKENDKLLVVKFYSGLVIKDLVLKTKLKEEYLITDILLFRRFWNDIQDYTRQTKVERYIKILSLDVKQKICNSIKIETII